MFQVYVKCYRIDDHRVVYDGIRAELDSISEAFNYMRRLHAAAIKCRNIVDSHGTLRNVFYNGAKRIDFTFDVGGGYRISTRVRNKK